MARKLRVEELKGNEIVELDGKSGLGAQPTHCSRDSICHYPSYHDDSDEFG